MLNIAYTHASVVLVIFRYHMLQNKQSDRHSLYSMTSVVVFFAYPIKLNILTRNRVTKTLPKKLHYNSTTSSVYVTTESHEKRARASLISASELVDQ